jgi:hypothetical protein
MPDTHRYSHVSMKDSHGYAADFSVYEDGSVSINLGPVEAENLVTRVRESVPNYYVTRRIVDALGDALDEAKVPPPPPPGKDAYTVDSYTREILAVFVNQGRPIQAIKFLRNLKQELSLKDAKDVVDDVKRLLDDGDFYVSIDA